MSIYKINKHHRHAHILYTGIFIRKNMSHCLFTSCGRDFCLKLTGGNCGCDIIKTEWNILPDCYGVECIKVCNCAIVGRLFMCSVKCAPKPRNQKIQKQPQTCKHPQNTLKGQGTYFQISLGRHFLTTMHTYYFLPKCRKQQVVVHKCASCRGGVIKFIPSHPSQRVPSESVDTSPTFW